MAGFGFTTVAVVGGSMEPTISAGDVCVVRKTRKVRPGDIVVAYHPERDDFLLVKRAIRPEGEGWWLEGDNANASDDSRGFGAISTALILGKVIWTRRQRPARRRTP